MYTVQDIQKLFGVTDHTVLGWIRNGELPAINVGRNVGKRKPRWRISQAGLEHFQRIRSAVPSPVENTQTTRRRKRAEVVDLFP